MRYWKGRNGTSKQGQCGTFDDLGPVPDSDEVSKEEYQAWIDSLPVTPKKDLKDAFSKASTTADKIDILAEALGLKA
jgi:hypothetical protein